MNVVWILESQLMNDGLPAPGIWELVNVYVTEARAKTAQVQFTKAVLAMNRVCRTRVREMTVLT